VSEDRSPADLLDVVVQSTRKLADALRPGDGEYKLRQLVEVEQWAKAQQPHHVGDVVTLRHCIDFVESPGWTPYADILEVGAIGVVTDVRFSGRKWRANVEIDGETFSFPMGWLDKARP
jgi:hypothetical protein